MDSMDREILKVIADNPTLLATVRDVFESEFSAPKHRLSELDLDNLQLGERQRGRLTGLEGVNRAMTEIERYKTREVRKSKRSVPR